MQKDKLLKVLELLEARKQLEENLGEFLMMMAIDHDVDLDDLKQVVDVDKIVSDLADANEGYFTDDELDLLISTSIIEKMSNFTENVGNLASVLVEKKLDDFLAARMSAPPKPSGNSGNMGPN